MKRLFKVLLILSVVLLSTSCNGRKDVVVFGETEWYKPWLWKEYEPVIMERTLVFDFNEDAKYWLKDKPLEFELRTINDEPVENIKLYINDELCENNVFTVSVENKEVKMGIVFDDSVEEGNHDYIIKYLGGNNKNKLDVVSFESFGHDNSITAKKKIVNNPAMVLTRNISFTFLITCVLWFLLSRLVIWRETSFSVVNIDYNDGNGPKRIKMSGKYELVCTNNNQLKDSLFAKIFKGKKQYEVNEFWTHDIVLGDGARRNKIKVQGLKNFSISGNSTRRVPFDIMNDKGNKVTIRTT